MTACSCDDGPRATAYRKSVHTARKAHTCYECRGPIRPGERYEYVFAVWDGVADHVRTCPRCVALRDWVVAHVPCSCWMHGSLLDDMATEVDNYWLEAPGLLMGYLRRRRAINAAKGWVRRAGAWVKMPRTA